MLKMNILATLISGSELYGLNTKDSDKDEISIFLQSDPRYILGLRASNYFKKDSENDFIYYEFRKFLHFLEKTNFVALDFLYAPRKYFKILNRDFCELILNQKENLINPTQLYNACKGYIHNEKRLAIGIRPGKIGNKRYAMVKQYGFSPKNLVQCFRLCYAVTEFLNTGYYPVNLKETNQNFCEYLFDIKTNPAKFNLTHLLNSLTIYEQKFETAWQMHKEYMKSHFTFDEAYSTEVCLFFYKKILNSL
jgi:predicted nucleotidyltransferase